MKTYTGDYNTYLQCRNYLIEKGYTITDKEVIHVGNNVYEFEETSSVKMGCNEVHKILCWIEEGEVKYKTKVIGWYCLD